MTTSTIKMYTHVQIVLPLVRLLALEWAKYVVFLLYLKKGKKCLSVDYQIFVQSLLVESFEFVPTMRECLYLQCLLETEHLTSYSINRNKFIEKIFNVGFHRNRLSTL